MSYSLHSCNLDLNNKHQTPNKTMQGRHLHQTPNTKQNKTRIVPTLTILKPWNTKTNSSTRWTGHTRLTNSQPAIHESRLMRYLPRSPLFSCEQFVLHFVLNAFLYYYLATIIWLNCCKTHWFYLPTFYLVCV